MQAFLSRYDRMAGMHDYLGDKVDKLDMTTPWDVFNLKSEHLFDEIFEQFSNFSLLTRKVEFQSLVQIDKTIFKLWLICWELSD